MADWFTQLAGSFESHLRLLSQLTLAGVSIFTVGHILLHKRNPRPAAMWVVVCVALPGLGALVYWMFGFNRISTRTRLVQNRWPVSVAGRELSDAAGEAPSLPARFHELAKIGLRITGRPLSGGNHVRALRNGEELYPPMLEAIRTATSSIWLSTYIFDRDEVGLEFAEALGQATERGVDVRVLIDGLGEWYSPRRIGGVLIRNGVQVERFLAPSIVPPSLHVNLRYHRKLLIVDGRLAYTGGMNIGLRHMVTKRSRRTAVRDMHFEVTGPVVAEMEEVFREDWTFASGELSWPEAAPPGVGDTAPGDAYVRAVSSGPNEDLERLRWIILGVLSQAQESVRIMTPYFIAEASLVAAMNAAVLRGVRVELILPKRNNLTYMSWAARSQLWQILEFGVRVFEQSGAFSHTKLILIDDDYALIGSANLDPRSLRLNFEFNLEVYGGDCPRELDRHFSTALQESREISLEELEARPLWVRLRDAVAALFSPYL
ncbi:MAG: cardiolipin synthase [Deltaproteobacteria bacterium]|nr:cardiolipin synthase [Deltaproteobacteria bacterium]